MQKPYLEAGKIVNTHGVRGEVRIQPWADDAAFLLGFRTFYIDGAPVHVAHSRVHKGMLVVKFADYDDVNAAMTLKNRVVSIARADVTLPDGQTVPARAILFTTCAGHYVTLTLRGEQSLRVRTTQNAMAELLLACPGFVACNKGTLVNLSAVARLEEGRLLMSNGEYLSLSRRRAAEVKKAYFDYQIDDFRRGER